VATNRQNETITRTIVAIKRTEHGETHTLVKNIDSKIILDILNKEEDSKHIAGHKAIQQ
jgi:hypothetical protein